MNKSAKLASIIFTGLLLLPMLGLLILDYQLKVANDLTGAFLLSESATQGFGNVIALVLIGLVAAFTLTKFFSKKVKIYIDKAKLLPKNIDSEIAKVEAKLKNC